MRRLAAIAVLGAVLLAACTQEARPEGVAESWLRSLNQGAAGRPDRYAPDNVSDQVVPGWHDLEPGSLDRIDVALQSSDAQTAAVLFRVEDVDGRVTAGTAHLQADGDSWTVTGVDLAASDLTVAGTSSGGLPLGWPLAALAGAVFALLALGLLSLVRRRAARA